MWTKNEECVTMIRGLFLGCKGGLIRRHLLKNSVFGNSQYVSYWDRRRRKRRRTCRRNLSEQQIPGNFVLLLVWHLRWSVVHKDDLSPNGLALGSKIEPFYSDPTTAAPSFHLLWWGWSVSPPPSSICQDYYMIVWPADATETPRQWRRASMETMKNPNAILSTDRDCGPFSVIFPALQLLQSKRSVATGDCWWSKMRNGKVKTKADFSNLNFIIIPSRAFSIPDDDDDATLSNCPAPPVVL